MDLSRPARSRWTGSRTRRAALIVVIAASAASSCTRFHGGSDVGQEWIGAWEAAPQLTEPANMPPAPGLSGNTLRQRIHPSLGGTQWRFRLSNEFGDGTVGDTVGPRRPRQPRGRDRSVDRRRAAVRRTRVADALARRGGDVGPDFVFADAFSDIAITLHLARTPSGLTGHPGSRTTSFIAPGNQVAARTSRAPRRRCTGT